MPNEVGYLICRRGKALLKEHETTGGDHHVDVSTMCSRGIAVALVHTHNVNPMPSPLDLETARAKKLAVCVDFKGIVTCYRMR